MQALRLALAGALGALLAWLISEPFARTAAIHGTHVGTMYFTLGSFFGWFAHSMLGGFVVGAITVTVNLQRAQPARVALMGLAGFILGGFLGWISDATSDRIMISMLQKDNSLSAHFGASFFWNILVAMSLALGIVLCCYPTVSRFVTVMLGGLIAAVLGYITRMIVEPIVLVAVMIGSGQNAAVQVWRPFDISRLADHMVMGVVLGLAIGLTE